MAASRAMGLVALAGIGLAGLLFLATRPPPLVVQGEVTADRIDVSARVAGRIERIGVRVGDRVDAGQVLAEIASPQLVADRNGALAALAVARAARDRVNSIRPETVTARRADLAAAEADVVLFEDSYDRQSQLLRSGNTPKAKVDEAARNREAALRRREAAQAGLDLAGEGASAEERALAAAEVAEALAALRRQDADVAELLVKAPVAAEVATRLAEPGEIFSAGAPLLVLVRIDAPWFTFNLREDLVGGVAIGDEITVTVPAFGHRAVAARITMINVEGQYATWRATRATGDFDLRTFEVRAVPIEPVPGLRPGMSVLLAWPATGDRP